MTGGWETLAGPAVCVAGELGVLLGFPGSDKAGEARGCRAAVGATSTVPGPRRGDRH